MAINWADLPTFDWRSVISAALGAVVTWIGMWLQKKNSASK